MSIFGNTRLPFAVCLSLRIRRRLNFPQAVLRSCRRILRVGFSRRRGGRFRPHKSHQSGRDVDVRFPRKPGVPKWGEPNRHEIDWMATWLLFKALIDTGAVQSIYVTAELQRDLYEAARALGFTHEELGPLITYPRDGPKQRAIVRHEKGHDDHFHVRFTCGPDEPKCRK